MKNGHNPTRAQKQLIKASGHDPDQWWVTKNLGNVLHLEHRYTGQAKIIFI